MRKIEIEITDKEYAMLLYRAMYDGIASPDIGAVIGELITRNCGSAGYSSYNEQIESFERAQFSGSPITKESFRDYSDISRNMKNEEVAAGNITKVTGDIYNYPAFPVTPAWSTTGDSISSSTAYNNAFRTTAIQRADARAQAVFQKFSNPRWTIKTQIRGEDIIVGDLIDFTSIAHGLKNVLVRVTQVTHSITPSQGWITSITAEEDESTIEVAQ